MSLHRPTPHNGSATIEAIGRAAVEILVGQIEGARPSAEELFFEPEIVARGSTATVPVTAVRA
jgi:DNA-binding LacI/PurR family transcriptional regulator